MSFRRRPVCTADLANTAAPVLTGKQSQPSRITGRPAAGHHLAEVIMSQSVIVRYKTRADAAEENQRLVERVFAELAQDDPGGLRYATFRLADGVTFVHVATIEGEVNPLQKVSAFAEFQRDIASRCVEPPAVTDATIVGSYRATR